MIRDIVLNPIIRMMILSEALQQEQYGALPEQSVEPIRCIHQGSVEIYSLMKQLIDTFEQEDWSTFAERTHQALHSLATLLKRSESLLIGNHSLSSQQEEKLQEARQDSRFIQLQVNNLTDYACLQIEPDYSVRRYETSQLLSTLSTFPMTARPITMNWSIAPSLPEVTTNRYCFHRSLENLIANAVSFTETGRITIGVFPTKEHLEVRVSDTGIGISEENQSHIFVPFWKADKDANSLGLGLTVAKGLIEQQHGELLIESATGVGSTFTMTLPYN